MSAFLELHEPRKKRPTVTWSTRRKRCQPLSRKWALLRSGTTQCYVKCNLTQDKPRFALLSTSSTTRVLVVGGLCTSQGPAGGTSSTTTSWCRNPTPIAGLVRRLNRMSNIEVKFCGQTFDAGSTPFARQHWSGNCLSGSLCQLGARPAFFGVGA
jgi:hypothetical protein